MDAEGMEAEHNEEVQQAYQRYNKLMLKLISKDRKAQTMKSDCLIVMKQIPHKCVIKALKF